MCRLTLMVLPCAAVGFWAAALYDNSCLFVARSQISVSAVVTTLLANHINLASHNARHNSDLIGAGSTYKTNNLRLKVQICPYLSLRPVPRNTFLRTSYKGLFFSIICSRFHFENSQHADQKQLTRRRGFDLDPGSTRRLLTSCRARPQ